MNVFGEFTDKLIKLQIVNNEDKDLYVYGFQQCFLLFLNMITVMVIGIIFNMIWQSLVFMITYSLLRAYAGGYHASSQSMCYLFSIGMIIAVLLGIKLIPWNDFICFIITIMSSTIILLLAPVEDKNKTLDQEELYVFKKRTRVILIAFVCIKLILLFTGQQQISICMDMAMLTLAIMLILGKIKNISGGEIYV
nr:accessory gene regulator B family protein [Sedimentibacter sp.]